MENRKQILSRDRLEAELLTVLRRDPGFASIEKVEIRHLDSNRGANWNLAKISPPIVLGGGTRWQSIKQAVAEMQQRYDMAKEEPALEPPMTDDNAARAQGHGLAGVPGPGER